MRNALTILIVAGANFAGIATAQVADLPAPRPAASNTGAAAPVTNASQLAALLVQLDETVRAANLDIAHLRIEKWKTDAGNKKQSQGNADSITRNVGAALPGMEDQVRANPQSVGAAFRLYRNVSALYDVFSSLTESTGAFGSKSEFEALSKDADALEKLRRAMGDQLESMTSANDAEIMRLRLEAVRANSPPVESAKKIVVDEDEKPKKPAPVHKKPAKPAAKPPSDNSGPQNTTPPASPPKQ